jgi:hypothetical protein
MGPLSYMQSVVDRNVVMWRMTVLHSEAELNSYMQTLFNVLFLPLYITTQRSGKDFYASLTISKRWQVLS